jgi:hypothetical protein
MFVSAEKAAEQFDITVEKLQAMSKRKDCVADLVNTKGEYDTTQVAKMLKHMRKQAEMVRAYQAKKRAAKTTTSELNGGSKEQSCPESPQAAGPTIDEIANISKESFEEFTLRFWETGDIWRDFVSAEADEKWMRYFINAALEFGHKTAYPAD